MNSESALQNEIIALLRQSGSSYANPLNSTEIGRRLNVSPPYVRTRMRELVRDGVVAVRRGNGGGYYLTGGVSP